MIGNLATSSVRTLQGSDSEVNTSKLSSIKCKHCDKGFTYAGNLEGHKRQHTGQGPLKYKQCNKAFRVAGNLKVHERKHAGEKPFKCKHCNKTFDQAGNLKVHERIHTGEKPFKCKHCNKAFCWRSYLKVHEERHRCWICLEMFKTKPSLREHYDDHMRFLDRTS